MKTKAVGNGGDADIEMIGKTGQNRLLTLEDRGQRILVCQVGRLCRERTARNLARIDAGDGKACLGEQFCGQMAHLSEAENGNLVERHDALPFLV